MACAKFFPSLSHFGNWSMLPNILPFPFPSLASVRRASRVQLHRAAAPGKLFHRIQACRDHPSSTANRLGFCMLCYCSLCSGSQLLPMVPLLPRRLPISLPSPAPDKTSPYSQGPGFAQTRRMPRIQSPRMLETALCRCGGILSSKPIMSQVHWRAHLRSFSIHFNESWSKPLIPHEQPKIKMLDPQFSI